MVEKLDRESYCDEKGGVGMHDMNVGRGWVL